MKVTVAKIGERVQVIDGLVSGSTANDAINQAFPSGVCSGHELRVNNRKVSGDVELKNGDVITLVPPIKAG